MASRTTTDPIEILLEMGVDLDNLSSEEDYLSALMEAAATIEFQTKGSGDDRSAALRKEIIEVRKKRKAADPKFKAKTAKISKSSFKPKAKPKGPKALPTSALVPYKKPEEESEEESKSEKKKKNVKVDKNDKLLSSILKNVIAIKGLIKERLNVTKSIRDIERKNLQKQKRKAKEDSLEKDKKGKGFLKKLKGALPQLSIFDAIFNWIKNVVMGRILIKIIDWMSDPKNKKKLETLGRFLKDWWPALTAAFVLFATPLGSFIRTVVSGMARLTAFLVARAIPALLAFAGKNPIAALAIGTAIAGGALAFRSKDSTEQQLESKGLTDATPKKQADELSKPGSIMETFTRGILPSLNEREGFSGGGMARGTDTVPAMLTPGEFVMSRGAVDKFGSDFMESINAAGGGTNKPKIVSGTTYAQGGGSIIASDAKTSYYDPSLGGINASGYKTAGGLPQTSTGEGYKPEVFSAAAFPPLLKLLPKDMTVPAENFPGGRTLKQPFHVIVTKGDKKAVVRVNDVGPGVAGHADNHMLDFSVATKNYLGTGSSGFTIHMAKSNSPLGPIDKDEKISNYTISFDGLRSYGGYSLPSLDKIPNYSQEKDNNRGYKTGDLVKNKPGSGNKIMIFDGFGWADAKDSRSATSQGTVLNTVTGKSASSYQESGVRTNLNISGIDFSDLRGTSAFSDVFAGARQSLGTVEPTSTSNNSSSTSIQNNNNLSILDTRQQIIPIPIEKFSPIERLKPSPRNTIESIDLDPITSAFGPPSPNPTNSPHDPDFPTISGCKESINVREICLLNTLGGDGE
jgi:hypothetical protein